ncbi:OmpA family protein [Sphingomonas alba]|uniref:OmpA family protein n=1 Tax=Sphingomonas alba TaxID=2908208 RepID=A0ABT0RNM2_9SPHN|nr:OmpA family protein [Sphingomonas alba]MCL6684170.1 OmpA family protein [Sphingomonas alba]
MTNRAIRLLTIGAAAAALYIAPAIAQMQEVQGIVVSNRNGALVIKTPSGDQTIQLAPDARIRSVSGALGGQKEVVPPSALIPGLPITIEADASSGHLVARDIEYKAKDFKTAAQIQAGNQEMRTAYSKIGQWDIRAEETIYFKTGSAVISPEDKQRLTALGKKAAGIKGYAISVLGYADPRGNAAANEKLSNRRAQTVINYLKQSGTVLPGRVLGASAMGEMNIPIEKPDAASLQGARKVVVRVLTSAAHLPQ